MLLIYSSTHTRPPVHLDLIDGEDADALAHILFPPLRADKESLNALLGQVGTVKGTVAFAASFAPSPNPFHHIITKKRHTVVFHPPETATHLILVRPPTTGPHTQIEHALVRAWDGFALVFGPDPWDSPGAVDWWEGWTYQVKGIRHWIAGQERDTHVAGATGTTADVFDRIGSAVEACTDAPVIAAYALTSRQTTYTSQPPEGALLAHLRDLLPSAARRPAPTTASTTAKYPALGLGAAPSNPPATTTSSTSSGSRWPSLGIPGFGRSSMPKAASSTPPPPPPAVKAPNNLSAWLGFSAPVHQEQSGAVLPPPPKEPRAAAEMHLGDLEDALSEDIHAPALSLEWHLEQVWLCPPAAEEEDLGASEVPRRYTLAYTIVGEVLVALVLDTLTPLETLTNQLNQLDTPRDTDHDGRLASVRDLVTCLADVQPPPRPDATPETDSIHLTRSTVGTRLRSSWNPGQLLQPADARAGRARKRDITVDQAGGWAKGLFTTIDHARELFARTGDVWIAGRAAEAGDEAYVVSRGDEKTSIVDAESMLRRVMGR